MKADYLKKVDAKYVQDVFLKLEKGQIFNKTLVKVISTTFIKSELSIKKGFFLPENSILGVFINKNLSLKDIPDILQSKYPKETFLSYFWSSHLEVYHKGACITFFEKKFFGIISREKGWEIEKTQEETIKEIMDTLYEYR